MAMRERKQPLSPPENYSISSAGREKYQANSVLPAVLWPGGKRISNVGSKITTEMAKRGYTKKQIAEWLAANSAEHYGAVRRMNDGLSDTLPQYPAPWQ